MTQQGVHQLVGRGDLGPAAGGVGNLGAPGVHRALEIHRRIGRGRITFRHRGEVDILVAATDAQFKNNVGLGRQREAINRAIAFETGRGVKKIDFAEALDVIESAIEKLDAVLAEFGFERLAMPLALDAAHLEQVDEIHAEAQFQIDLDRSLRVIAHDQAVEKCRLAERPTALELNRIAGEVDNLAIHTQVGVSQVDA